MSKQDPGRLASELKSTLKGEVLGSPMSRSLYSTDASLYQITPACIAVPADSEDVLKCVSAARRFKIPILARGAGTSLAGQCVSDGLVLDFSRHMRNILEINAVEQWVRVQPGIVLDQLNLHLRENGLFFAPDVATANRATIGGMIGNNSAGLRSVRYGKTIDHVLELKAVLGDGREMVFKEVDRTGQGKGTKGTESGEIYAETGRVIDALREEIILRFPDINRLVNGYALNKMLDDGKFNPGLLLCGAEGTLGIITEAKLRLVPIPPETALLVLESRTFAEAMSAVSRLLSYLPSAVETLDRESLDMARSNSLTAASSRKFFSPGAGAVLVAEFSGNTREEIAAALAEIRNDREITALCFALREVWDEKERAALWQVRKDTLGLLMNVEGDFKPLPFIEDTCIPPRHLAEYVEKVEAICTRYGRRMVSYGHAGAGVLHIRPFLNLNQPEERQILLDISGEVFDLVRAYGGAWSGEHGDGLVRSYKLREFYGDTVYRGFEEIKKIFDPEGLMNPGKIVNPLPPDENFRVPSGKALDQATLYRFFEENGYYSRAVDKCTGVGLCLNALSGSMCPTFQATRKEEDSTRGRANALRAALARGPEGINDRELYDILDKCLACKSCKSECPSHVDLARLKAEFLAHYYRRNRVPLRNRLVKASESSARLASIAPGFFNRLLRFPLIKAAFFKMAGFDTRRNLPAYARESLKKETGKVIGAPGTRKMEAPGIKGSRKRVVLFADTWTRYYEPRVGVSACRILDRLGYEVIMADVGCCGRPLISAGFLAKVKKDGAGLVRRLEALGDGTEPVIILEPSCYATLKDDYPDLMEDRQAALKLAERVITMEEFLLRPENRDLLRPLLGTGPAEILFHGHCQQKALIGTSPTEEMLEMLPGTHVTTVDQGCCGMAGVFGYEKEHYELSLQIAELSLLPAIRKAPSSTSLAVSGFSCRCQVKHFTGREPLHPVELVAEGLKITEKEVS